jgi:NAD(P)H dehydrogenase (quinone)
MYAVMGITGQVGGAVARTLLRAGSSVRGIVRDKARAAKWQEAGVELVVADQADQESLKAAFQDVEGLFVMLPPNFAPGPGFVESRALIATLTTAIAAIRPRKIVALSSIGAHKRQGLGLITQLHLLEEALSTTPSPTAFLRPGWFMENTVWDIEPAARTGTFPSFLQPLDKPVPMVATDDVGRIVAELLREEWQGQRVVELEGPTRVSPKDLSAALSMALEKTVSAIPVPRNEWESLFKSQGIPWPAPRIEMLDGFNTNWISFEGAPATHVKGRLDLQTVIRSLVEQRQNSG